MSLLCVDMVLFRRGTNNGSIFQDTANKCNPIAISLENDLIKSKILLARESLSDMWDLKESFAKKITPILCILLYYIGA